MEADSPTEVLKNEKVIQVNVAKEDRTDTASRRSIVEKKSLWESSESDQNTPDPALLPLSQRMAKFEKLGSVPKPIARFGEPITPAMLAKASAGNRSNFVPASEPAWKRQKRDRSPKLSTSKDKKAHLKANIMKKEIAQNSNQKNLSTGKPIVAIHDRQMFDTVYDSDLYKTNSSLATAQFNHNQT